MKYTEKEWASLVKDPKKNAEINEEMTQYATSKGVYRECIGVRWVNGLSQYYVKPEKHRRIKTNND
jgi:hypothetical protein